LMALTRNRPTQPEKWTVRPVPVEFSEMDAPNIGELLIHPVVHEALEQAWKDSIVSDPIRRHEEGGWIYCDTLANITSVRRAPAGRRAALDLNSPPLITGSVVVATFHTHPNPKAEGWTLGPSPADTESAWLDGVPCLIRAEDGIHFTGPEARRGGLAGNAGFPQ